MSRISYLSFFCFALLLFACKKDESNKAPKETEAYVEILEYLLQDKDTSIQLNIAGNASTPIDVLENMAMSDNAQIRASVAGNLSTPADLLSRLGDDNTYEVKYTLAYNLNTPIDILENLAVDTTTNNVSDIVASRANLNLELFRLFYNNPDKREILASNPSLSIAHIQQIFNDGVGYYSIAMNPNTPLPILNSLSNMVDSIPEIDGSYTIYHPYALSLIANPSLPEKLIRQLAALDDNTINAGMFSFDELIARNPNTPQDILEKYANDTNTDGYFSLASNPNAPYEIAKQYFASEYEYLRTNAAMNKNIPSDSLIVMATNKDAAIRRGVANNPNTDKNTLILLAGDKDELVREYVALNTKSPIECLEILAKDSVEEVRAATADYQVLHITFYSDEIPYRTSK